jgi:hypothetical protein
LNSDNNSAFNIHEIRPSSILSDNLPSNASRLQDYYDGMNIRVYDENEAMPSLNLFSCSIRPNISVNSYEGYLLITDMDGSIVNGFYSEEEIVAPRLLNSTTIMYAGKNTKLITFWNWVTNETEQTNAPVGHHEWDYNPQTDEFAAFVGWEEDYYNEAENETYPATYDDLGIFDRDGNLLRIWSSNATFPFNYTEFSLRNEVRRGEYDWMHSNSIFWDVEEGAIYMSVRHLDASVKIDSTAMETDWVVGRYPGTADPYTLYDVNGEVIDSLYYHTHALEKTGPNEFVTYDNDFWNLTRDNPEIGITRYVRFIVNETAKTAREIWTWTSPAGYYANSQGNSDLMPNGNVIGTFNNPPEPWFTEVNSEGEIVWEMMYNITENNAGFKLPANGFERFVTEPLVENVVFEDAIAEGGIVTLTMSVWDTFKRRFAGEGTITVLESASEIVTDDIEFLPYWQETEVSLEIPALAAGNHNLTIMIENEDGITTTFIIAVSVTSYLPLIIGIGAVAVVIVVVVVYFVKKK